MDHAVGCRRRIRFQSQIVVAVVGQYTVRPLSSGMNPRYAADLAIWLWTILFMT